MDRPIGHLRQIPPGEGRNVAVPGAAGDVLLAVFHARDGQVYATQASCPHRGGPLADGLMDDTVVVCPLHDRTYDLRTGAGVGTDCSITVYKVRVEPDGTLMLLAEPVMGAAA